MALGFVNWQVEVAVGRLDDLQKEWQECRSVINQFDRTLADFRKYGFGLASGLLTANGILGGIANLLPKPGNGTLGFTVPSPVIAALVSTTMVLIAVLFVTDRYYSVLKWAAIDKARRLEWTLSLSGLTNEMLNWAGRQKWATYVALFQYGSFILVSVGLGVAVMGREAIPWPWSPDHLAADFMWFVGLFTLLAIIALFFKAKKEWNKLKTSREPLNSVQGVTSVTVSLTQLQSVREHSCKEQEVVVNPSLPQNSKFLAIVIPADQDGLSIVGCRIIDLHRLGITLSNEKRYDITLKCGNCTVFVYA